MDRRSLSQSHDGSSCRSRHQRYFRSFGFDFASTYHMETATVFEEKNSDFWNVPSWCYVSLRCLVSVTIAHGIISACFSAAMRLYCGVELQDSEDKVYWFSKLALWTLLELVSGILAACLPVSLKFLRSLKESSLWSKLRGSLQSFPRPKFPALWTSDTQSGAQTAAKGGGSSSRLKRRFREYSHVGSERSMQGETWMEMPSNHIKRTTDIVTTTTTNKSAPNSTAVTSLTWGACNPRDE